MNVRTLESLTKEELIELIKHERQQATSGTTHGADVHDRVAQALSRCEEAYFHMVRDGTPDDKSTYEMARAHFWEVLK